jgi:hypothetical protein
VDLDPTTIELLAKAIHDSYVAAQHGTASSVPWSVLPERLKESNRAQARDIPVKLARIGCTIQRGPRSEFMFTATELDRLAEEEHERWVSQRLSAARADDVPGWEQHPGIVPWAVLPEVEREKDRDAVRNIPTTLATAALHVERSA